MFTTTTASSVAEHADSLELAIGPLSEEDVATLALAAYATEPHLRASAERLAGRPQRLVLHLDRSPRRPSSALRTQNEPVTP